MLSAHRNLDITTVEIARKLNLRQSAVSRKNRTRRFNMISVCQPPIISLFRQYHNQGGQTQGLPLQLEMDASRKRKSIRLPGYDYSRTGAYFVSICTEDRKCLFVEIVNQEMVLNDAGRMVKKWYEELEIKFQDIRCNEYVIMPNHSHVIITNIGRASVGADLRVCPNGNWQGRTSGEHIGSPLHRVIQWFKKTKP